jgi:hypothetical protein
MSIADRHMSVQIRCKARRHRWHLRQPWHRGICNDLEALFPHLGRLRWKELTCALFGLLRFSDVNWPRQRQLSLVAARSGCGAAHCSDRTDA